MLCAFSSREFYFHTYAYNMFEYVTVSVWNNHLMRIVFNTITIIITKLTRTNSIVSTQCIIYVFLVENISSSNGVKDLSKRYGATVASTRIHTTTYAKPDLDIWYRGLSYNVTRGTCVSDRLSLRSVRARDDEIEQVFVVWARNEISLCVHARSRVQKEDKTAKEKEEKHLKTCPTLLDLSKTPKLMYPFIYIWFSPLRR